MPWLPPVQEMPVMVAVLPFRTQTFDPSLRLTLAIWLLCRFENVSVSSSFQYWMLFRWHIVSLIPSAVLEFTTVRPVPLGAAPLGLNSLTSSQPFVPYA